MSTDQGDRVVHQPPPKLSRKERRAWQAAEGARLAGLARHDGNPLLASLRPPIAPRQLGRVGRRGWRDTEMDNRRERLQDAVAAESAAGESDRYVGAILLMAGVLIIIVLRVFLFGGSDDPTPPPPSPAVVVTTTPAPLGHHPESQPQSWPAPPTVVFPGGVR